MVSQWLTVDDGKYMCEFVYDRRTHENAWTVKTTENNSNGDSNSNSNSNSTTAQILIERVHSNLSPYFAQTYFDHWVEMHSTAYQHLKNLYVRAVLCAGITMLVRIKMAYKILFRF